MLKNDLIVVLSFLAGKNDYKIFIKIKSDIVIETFWILDFKAYTVNMHIDSLAGTIRLGSEPLLLKNIL